MAQAAKRPYIPELDLVRAFGILAVIMIHATSSVVASYDHQAALYPLYVFLNTAAKFAVPVFVFLSGFVLFYNYYDKPFTAGTIGQFYKKRMSKILMPFLLFSIFYFAYTRFMQFGFVDVQTFIGYFTTTKFLNMLLSGKTYTHLYFVIIIIQFYAISPLLLYAVKKFPFLGKHIIWIGMLVQWLFVYKLAGEWGVKSPGSYCFTYMLYFTAGAFIGIYYMKLAPWINLAKHAANPRKIAAAIGMWLLFLASSMLLFYFHYENRLYKTAVINTDLLEIIDEVRCITAGILLLQVSFWAYAAWNKAVVRALIHIGATSFGIYLVHPFILNLYRNTSSVGDPILYHAWVVGGFLAALLIPWAIVSLSAPIKWHWLLFGPLPTRKKKTSASVQPGIEA
ncbi:peptidoglycan/LPS O-acetylase OafA/YrhL [Paenibacillus endophyticus]|uniref:Peptidoglycan/LPS O-acetylase OafA/YrhL n=1 Tax=Paenibacillus endophyticus TaxID=1294268 RepID=A0A7W5GD15_9BACL|nr:acyltransferase [Paenibacillus endophyticus]MBB3155471.1 peptidoglycan/LPS O-acetylase OafA/YrhL [Paenibacillus endophyticus]